MKYSRCVLGAQEGRKGVSIPEGDVEIIATLGLVRERRLSTVDVSMEGFSV
jgi:hypothetical protein